MYGRAGDPNEEGRATQEQFARAHYEQHMRVTGGVRFDERQLEIEGYGLRDHSWGPRTWQAIHSYEWLTLNFGDDLGAMVSIIRRTPESARVGVVDPLVGILGAVIILRWSHSLVRQTAAVRKPALRNRANVDS